MFNPAIIDDLKGRIVEVISSRIPVRKSGSSWKAVCPFHDDKNPSLHISEKKRHWRCFVCDEHGDTLDFIQKYHGVDFVGALEVLGVKQEREGKENAPLMLKAFEAITHDANHLLTVLKQREEDLCWLSRQLNALLNTVSPENREAWMYSEELKLEEEFNQIREEREKIHEIARLKKREVQEWLHRQQAA